MKPIPVIILGIHGNCLEIAEAVEWLAEQGKPLKVAGWLDDNTDMQGQTVAGYPVLGKLADAVKFNGAQFVNGIGSPESYRHKSGIIASTGVTSERWATVVHPAASVSRHAQLGRGSVVLAHSAIGAGASIGDQVLILQNSVISHESVVGDYSAIATGVCVSGRVTIGCSCYLGSNCSIRSNIRVGDGALIGMGAVVTRDVPPDATVVGNPARILKK